MGKNISIQFPIVVKLFVNLSGSGKIQEHYSLTNGQALTGSDIVHAFNDNIRLLGPVTKLYAIDWSY